MDINGGRPFLPEDFIVNILKRLPVKPLIRFRCVCKDWNILLRSPCFIHHHLHHSSLQNPSLLISSDDNDDAFYSLSFTPTSPSFHHIHIPPFNDDLLGLSLVGSTNGILCFTCVTEYKHPNTPSPLLWNPATREFRPIPIAISHHRPHVLEFGFGFCPIADDYKIVAFFYSFSHHPCVLDKVLVFSLSTGLWRAVEFDNIKHVSISSYAVDTAHGVMFWRGSKAINGTSLHMTHVIISFDIATQVFKVIPWPHSVPYGGKLAVCDGKLANISSSKNMFPHYCHFEGMNDGIFLRFSVMGEDGRWSSSTTYSTNSDICFCDGIIWRDQIVCIDWSKPTLTDQGIVHNNERLYLIDVDADECKQFDIPRPKFGRGVSVFNYVESLVPLRANIRIEEA